MVELADGSSFFSTLQLLAGEGLTPADLREGAPLGQEALQRLVEGGRELACRLKALDLLAARAHSRRGLGVKLLRRGFPAAVVEGVLDRLEEQQLLDDRRFADQWVESRLRRRPEGPFPLIAGLRRRGVPRAVAEQAVRSRLGPEEERRSAREALRRLRRRGMEDPSALIARLAARGFRASLVRALLEEENAAE